MTTKREYEDYRKYNIEPRSTDLISKMKQLVENDLVGRYPNCSFVTTITEWQDGDFRITCQSSCYEDKTIMKRISQYHHFEGIIEHIIYNGVFEEYGAYDLYGIEHVMIKRDNWIKIMNEVKQ